MELRRLLLLLLLMCSEEIRGLRVVRHDVCSLCCVLRSLSQFRMDRSASSHSAQEQSHLTKAEQ
jgi:hypothetical protein